MQFIDHNQFIEQPYVKCAGCGAIIDVPPELAGDNVGYIDDVIYYCDACEPDESCEENDLEDCVWEDE